MTITSPQHAGLAADAYEERAPGTTRPKSETHVDINGVKFKILEQYDNPRTGYQGTIYQRIDTHEIVVAHRGTEFGREPLKDGFIADGGMVLTRTNAQAAEAIALTERAMDLARQYGIKNNIPSPEVTVTGHSLGGTLAQITAHRLNLRGEAFNPYGAVSLKYGVPEGGDRFLNHVMAGDTVSAAGPHYGHVQMYAKPSEVVSLLAAGYGRFNPAPDNPAGATLSTMGVAGSHYMDNFLDVDGKGRPDRSVLSSPASQVLAREYADMFNTYRHDVRVLRGAISLAGDAQQHTTQRLIPIQADDAIHPETNFKKTWGDLPRQMANPGNSVGESVGVLRAPPANAKTAELFQNLHATLTSGDQAAIDRGLSNIATADLNRNFREHISARVDLQEQYAAQQLVEQQQQEPQRAIQIGHRIH